MRKCKSLLVTVSEPNACRSSKAVPNEGAGIRGAQPVSRG